MPENRIRKSYWRGQLLLEEDKAALGISSGKQAYVARLETLQSQ
jgi:hypothetical protein